MPCCLDEGLLSSSKAAGLLPAHSTSELGWGPHKCVADAPPHGPWRNRSVAVVDPAGTRRPPWWLLTLPFFFCSLSLVCGVVERDMNQGAVLEICEVPAPETEGQREVGRQGSFN